MKNVCVLMIALLSGCATGYHLECSFDDDAGGVLICHQEPNNPGTIPPALRG